MSWKKPDWYMTTEEFAELVVHSLEVTHHFKRGERVHPEDIVSAFVTAAETIGIGAGAVGKKVWAAEKKNAVMETGNIRKNNLPIHDLTEDELGYSEYRHKNAYM
jgi:hypothetical protein